MRAVNLHQSSAFLCFRQPKTAAPPFCRYNKASIIVIAE